MRRSERDELARRMQAWFDRTEPDERGPLVAVVLLGLIAAPVMLFTVVVLGVALLRLVSGRGAGPLQRLLVAVVGLQVVLQLVRWAVMRRLRKAMGNVEAPPAR
jgi:hypothetical protein